MKPELKPLEKKGVKFTIIPKSMEKRLQNHQPVVNTCQLFCDLKWPEAFLQPWPCFSLIRWPSVVSVISVSLLDYTLGHDISVLHPTWNAATAEVWCWPFALSNGSWHWQLNSESTTPDSISYKPFSQCRNTAEPGCQQSSAQISEAFTNGKLRCIKNDLSKQISCLSRARCLYKRQALSQLWSL